MAENPTIRDLYLRVVGRQIGNAGPHELPQPQITAKEGAYPRSLRSLHGCGYYGRKGIISPVTRERVQGKT